MLATVGFAQSTLVATLSHEGNISTYFGTRALIEAHSAAVDGDVITLSSGSFVPVNITKAVTIHGAGMKVDSILGTPPTIITGDFSISIADNGTDRLTLEGIYHNATITYKDTLINPSFVKCRFSNFLPASTDDYFYLINASFTHCKIASSLVLNYGSSASCNNCVITNPYSGQGYGSYEITNCAIFLTKKGSTIYTENGSSVDVSGTPNGIKHSSLNNCIIYVKETNTGYGLEKFPSSTTLYNNVSNYSGAFTNSPNATNKVAEMNSLFLNYTTAVDNSDYTLTEEAARTYLGTDGSQVGIYGGIYPFDPVPTNLRVTRCNVASQSSPEGTLSVDIEVNGGQ